MCKLAHTHPFQPSLFGSVLPGQSPNPATLDLHISLLVEVQLLLSTQTPDRAPDTLTLATQPTPRAPFPSALMAPITLR